MERIIVTNEGDRAMTITNGEFVYIWQGGGVIEAELTDGTYVEGFEIDPDGPLDAVYGRDDVLAAVAAYAAC